MSHCSNYYQSSRNKRSLKTRTAFKLKKCEYNYLSSIQSVFLAGVITRIAPDICDGKNPGAAHPEITSGTLFACVIFTGENATLRTLHSSEENLVFQVKVILVV